MSVCNLYQVAVILNGDGLMNQHVIDEVIIIFDCAGLMRQFVIHIKWLLHLTVLVG